MSNHSPEGLDFGDNCSQKPLIFVSVNTTHSEKTHGTQLSLLVSKNSKANYKAVQRLLQDDFEDDIHRRKVGVVFSISGRKEVRMIWR